MDCGTSRLFRKEHAFGSLVTLGKIARHADAAARHPAFVEAVESVATPQIRNAGTLGGNLCQRPRCWYYRSPAFNCLKKGGDFCYAVEGGNKYHAILGADRCHIVHPSDAAVALVALDAEVEIFGEGGLRREPISELFVGPEDDILSETSLGVGRDTHPRVDSEVLGRVVGVCILKRRSGRLTTLLSCRWVGTYRISWMAS